MDNNVLIQPSNPLVELQSAFCLLKLAGEVWIGDLAEITAVQAGNSSGDVQMYRMAPGKLIMRRHLENLPVASNAKAVIDDFLISPNTKVFDAVAFSPLPTPPRTLNYWMGSTVQPVAGDWSTIGHFLLNVICGGDKQCFAYLLRFLAHMLQKPEEKPGIMIVLLGGQGTGKGTFFGILRAIWRHATLQVSDISHVIGQFNAAIERNYAICMDEALFAGDKKAMDRLKSLVTEPTITIEQKYQPRRTIESFHRFFAASNHKHFAQVDADDRRFMILRVSDAHKGDFPHWDDLHIAIKNPAVIAAMVHNLLAFDLSGFNIRERPQTAEHMAQKLRSLTSFDRYWYQVLQSGEFGSVILHDPQGAWVDPRFVSTEGLMADWKESEKGQRQFDTRQESDIHDALKRLCPSATKCRKMFHGLQKRGHVLPSLPVARAEFAVAMGEEVAWND